MHFLLITPIIVTLSAAIIGILWTEARWAKVALVILAVLTSITTLWEVNSQSEQITTAQGKLSSLVRVAKPNETFFQDVIDGSIQLAMEHRLEDGNTNRLIDGNTIIHFKRKGSSSVCGVLRLSPIMIESVFSNYSQNILFDSQVDANNNQEKLAPHIRAVFDSWMGGPKAQDELLLDIAYISQFPLERVPGEPISAEPMISTDSHNNKIVVVEMKRNRGSSEVVFDATYLERMATSNLFERGRLIFSNVWPDQAGSCSG